MVHGWGDTVGGDGETEEVHLGRGEDALLRVDGEAVVGQDGEDGGQVFVVRSSVLAGN